MERIDGFIKEPKKSLFILASPIMVAMIVQTMYNIVDTAFVGRLGSEALAAITFSFPLFFILIAVNSGIGAGMSSRISRFMGERKKEEAENVAMHGLVLSLIASFMLFIAGLFSLPSLFRLFGASGDVLEMAQSYMLIILMGIFFMFPAYAINSILSAQGDTKTPMKIQIVSLVLNASLDPVLIFLLDMGIKGAAIATSVSFIASLVLSIYYVQRHSHLHIHPSSFSFSIKLLKDIFSVGAPATIMILLMSFYVIFLNRFMVHFSIEHLAAFGIATRLESVAMLPVVGLSLGTLTLVGMFFGAKRYDLVKEISDYSARVSILISSIVAVIFFLMPTLFLRIFTSETALLSLGAPYLRLDVFTFPLMAINMSISRAMQGMGYGLPGLMINLVRIFAIALPLAYFFVFVLKLGYLSIAVAMITGGFISSLMAYIWIKIKVNKLNNN